MTTPTDPASVLRTIGHGLARGAEAVRRGVEALDAPTRLANARDDLRALEIDRRAAALARRGGAAARAAAGRARVQAQRAAATGGPALRKVWHRSAARLSGLPPLRLSRTPADPMARPAKAEPATPLPEIPLFAADGRTAPIPAHPTQAAPRRWLEDRKTQMTIGFGGLAISGLAVALAAAPPGNAPAPGSAAFGEAVRAYILEHPEIIPEAVAKLQQRDTDRTLAEHRKALETPFSGAWAGAPKGDVVIVEFTDYACGFCRASVADLDRLIAADPKLKVVYREIPILGPGSEQAATIALSAARQGRHAAVHRALFAAGSPTPEKSAAIVAAQKLDPTTIATAATDPMIAQEIADNLSLARAIGMTGTPTFVIGNHILSGAVGYDALKAAVAEARSAQ